MRKPLVLAALVALSTTGCVSQGKFDAKALEAENFAKGLNDEKGAREAAEAKVKALEEKIAELEQEREALNTRLGTAESRLTAGAAERRALEEKNSQLAALNDELARNTKKLAQAKEELEKRSSEYENLAQSLKQEISDGKIELSELKGKMTVQLKDKILFASGSARVGKEGEEALKKIADALKTVQGKIIRVEGHTDDVPTGGGQFPSNWELSLARAMAVVRSLQNAGVDPTFLSAAGYGQYQPIAANDSAENRSLNRRIEIVLAPK
ncbi:MULTISPECIES: OmpA family protein [Myxococcus]|uniref:Chemotaxis protein MotB n=1 Tax=Myxococcus xanthus (strain DK1622) TaxID=246197 RepID=Q1DE07_MYXXD|nr:MULTISPECIES: OmpA family protein [Myxococcus]ABF87588.1 putative chemotaxis protein MotB [Myxococcus xanthus DK 1622]NOJ57034.1 OmpA family protein [Myxococcus xanthus]NOK07027.1 OmpA family protein [Myxococcus xanthus]QDE80837.1 chemotaxis protein MotB [Myxococcus xanthus]QDE88195.1 chemotaxis protein MotB [Myxococcus xanthus]